MNNTVAGLHAESRAHILGNKGRNAPRPRKKPISGLVVSVGSFNEPKCKNVKCKECKKVKIAKMSTVGIDGPVTPNHPAPVSVCDLVRDKHAELLHVQYRCNN